MNSDERPAQTFDELAGALVRDLRLQAKMSQAELADAMTRRSVPTHAQTVLKIEQGSRPLRLAEAAAIAQVLNCDLDDILPGSFNRQAAAETALGEADAHLSQAQRALVEVASVLRRLARQVVATPSVGEPLGISSPEIEAVYDWYRERSHGYWSGPIEVDSSHEAVALMAMLADVHRGLGFRIGGSNTMTKGLDLDLPRVPRVTSIGIESGAEIILEPFPDEPPVREVDLERLRDSTRGAARKIPRKAKEKVDRDG